MMYVVALGLALQFLGFIFLVSVLIVVAQVVGSRYQDHPRRAPLGIIPKKALWLPSLASPCSVSGGSWQVRTLPSASDRSRVRAELVTLKT